MNISHECSSSSSGCKEGCIEIWIAASAAAGSSILTLIIVLSVTCIFFRCCTKEKRSQRKQRRLAKRQKISDSIPASIPPGAAVLDISTKNIEPTTPPKRRASTPTGTPKAVATAIYGGKSAETETPNLPQGPGPVGAKRKLIASDEKMEEIFEPQDLNSREVVNPLNPGHQKTQSTIELLKSDLFDNVKASPNIYPKK